MKYTTPALLLLGLLGCDAPAPGPPGPNDGPGAVDLAAPPDGGGGGDPLFGRSAGKIEILETRTPYNSASEVRAVFYGDEEVVFQREVLRSGACRLINLTPALCDQPCVGVCVERNVCKPYLPRLPAGALTITGLKEPAKLVPMAGNLYYADPALRADIFDAGAPISVSASGDNAGFGPFRVDSAGVVTLETATPVKDEVPLLNTSDLRFTWTPSGDAQARVRLTLNANNRGHGAPYEAVIECDGPDNGALTVSKELIAPFPATYRWEICAGHDCPLSSILRYRRGSARVGGREVALWVGSRRDFWILHTP